MSNLTGQVKFGQRYPVYVTGDTASYAIPSYENNVVFVNSTNSAPVVSLPAVASVADGFELSIRNQNATVSITVNVATGSTDLIVSSSTVSGGSATLAAASTLNLIAQHSTSSWNAL